MGRWLAALRAEEKSENATGANRQNPQNPPYQGFGGFGGSPPEQIQKITSDPDGGFGGFVGSSSGRFQNFSGIGDRSDLDDEERQYEFEERAAILEYDAGMSRVAAEAMARREIDERRSQA